jgi:hypothetical protein
VNLVPPMQLQSIPATCVSRRVTPFLGRPSAPSPHSSNAPLHVESVSAWLRCKERALVTVVPCISFSTESLASGLLRHARTDAGRMRGERQWQKKAERRPHTIDTTSRVTHHAESTDGCARSSGKEYAGDWRTF